MSSKCLIIIKHQFGDRVQPEYYLVNALSEVIEKRFGMVNAGNLEASLIEH